MNVVVMLLAIIAGLMAEQSMPPAALAGFARPPLVMAVVAYCALNHSMPLLLLAAIAGGLLGDAVSALPLGITSLTLSVAGTILYFSRDYIFSERLSTSAFMGVVLGLVAPCVTFILLLILGNTPFCFQPQFIFLKTAASAVYGAVVFPMVFFLLARLDLLIGAKLHNNL
jgi:rod shape-determining protein MreD